MDTVKVRLGQARKGNARLVIEVKVPRVPSFLQGAGVASGGTVDISDLDDRELGVIARAWTAQLIAHAKRRRAGEPDS